MLVAAVPASTADSAVSPADDVPARIDRLFAPWAKHDAPGCSAGVSRAGGIVFARGYGGANLETATPISPASIFHVASVSKPFTALSVLLLVEDGKVALDDDVRRFVPEWSLSERVTIRHLLTHTAGLRDAFLLIEMAAPHDGSISTTDQFVALLARQRGLRFAPGSRFVYDNGGYLLLGEIVRRVSGQSLRAFAEQRIFRPLGMTRTHVHDDTSEVVRGFATGYTRGPSGGYRLARAPGGVVGNAGLFTTAEDLLRWANNFAAPRVARPETLAAMQTAGTLAGGSAAPYGFGLFVERQQGRRTVSHGGEDPGASAYVVRYPDDDLAIAVLCNQDGVDAAGLARGIAEIYLGPAPEAPASTASAASAPAVASASLAAHEGLYRQPEEENLLRFVVRDGVLRGSSGAGTDEDGWAVTPLGDDRFAIPGTPITLTFADLPGRGHTVRIDGETPEPAVLERVAPYAPAAADLDSLAGAYASEELDVTYALAVRDAALEYRIPGRAAHALLPIRPDVFAGPLVGVIRFSRDAAGKPSGFTVQGFAARGIRFVRIRSRGGSACHQSIATRRRC
jgi:CubicO group peptidase (beta-lactamase class C family)